VARLALQDALQIVVTPQQVSRPRAKNTGADNGNIESLVSGHEETIFV